MLVIVCRVIDCISITSVYGSQTKTRLKIKKTIWRESKGNA